MTHVPSVTETARQIVEELKPDTLEALEVRLFLIVRNLRTDRAESALEAAEALCRALRIAQGDAENMEGIFRKGGGE